MTVFFTTWTLDLSRVRLGRPVLQVLYAFSNMPKDKWVLVDCKNFLGVIGHYMKKRLKSIQLLRSDHFFEDLWVDTDKLG